MVDAVLNCLYEREHWITVIHVGLAGRTGTQESGRPEHPFPCS